MFKTHYFKPSKYYRVGLTGLEPVTLPLSEVCSYH